MMRKLLLFFAMLCVSVGMRAAITITAETTPYSGYGIYGAKAGELAQLLNETYTGIVEWNGATLDQLKSAEYVKVGSISTPNILNNDDLAALELLSGARFLDIDGSVLDQSANITTIKTGSSIEAVTLPNCMTKEHVNAVGKKLATINSNFGSCLSLDTELEPRELTTYTYIAPCSSEVVEYTGTVTESGGNYTGSIGSVTRDVTLISDNSSFSYTNTKFGDDVVTLTADQVNGATEIAPNPLKVMLTARTTTEIIYTTVYNGLTITVPNYGLSDDKTKTKEFYSNEIQGTVPADLDVTTSYSNYTYKFMKGGWEQTIDFVGEPDGYDESRGYYANVENIYIPNNQGYQFPINANYSYSYSYVGTDCNVVTVEDSPTYPGETIDLEYDEDIILTATTQTINVPKEGEDATVIAYVNTPGSLYKATSLDKNDCKEADGLVISGNINNGDISVHDGAGDPNGNQNDDDKFVNSATPAFYLDNTKASIKSIDMSDAEIVDYKYLRVLDAYYTLETIIFPKDCERIPNYCCYTNGNSGLPFLKNVTFPENLKSIGDNAFRDTALETLVLPGTIQSVGDYAFYTCKQLENVEMESLSGTCTFGEWVFASSAVKHVTLSEGVDGISAHMFDACGALESVRIPTTAKKIKTGAFSACVSLHKLVIPEGVEEFEKNVFNLAGLTDIYVMATSEAKVPKIYDVGTTGDDEGTFTKRNILGNNTAPNKKYGVDYDNTTPEETAFSWYQEEFSDMNFGIGGNNCMIQLHYPENMKSFYNGVENIPDNWSDNLCYLADKTLAEWQVSQAQEWISEIYALGSEEYYGENFNSALKLGPTEGNLYWPKAQDYYIRLAIGDTPEDVPTAAAWRQIPLQGITSADDFTYTKRYDDTWYTMCFPWDMDDNTLFSTFNQKCEIVEFKGAEMVEQDDKTFNLVFHFDDVAATHYMNEDREYERIESEHTRTVTVQVGNAQVTRNYYTYQNVETGDLVYWPYDLTTDAGKAMQKEYNGIQHLMVFAGHPYMIHPSIGAKAGSPKDCTIAGVKKVEGNNEELTALAESKKVNKVVAKRVEIGTDEWTSGEAWTTPSGVPGGSYTFIGNINDEVIPEGATVGDGGKKDMPLPCYFLGVKSGSNWPMYYRRTTGGEKKWSQYTAIIVPDEAANANIEAFMSSGSSSSAGAKEIVFGNWEIVDEDQMATVIENAVAEGKDKNEPAKIQHMNVVYNIKGQVIRSNSSSVEGLPKGLYIVNGKKYMVK